MFIAKNSKELHLLPEMATRHGLVAGSTGSGKTITLQVIAENFSRIGVPVFIADVKGDLTGMEYPGVVNPKIEERIIKCGIDDFKFEGSPVKYWDVYGNEGEAIKTTVKNFGPNLLGRLLNLSEAQTGSLYQVFKIADENKITIKNLKDLYGVVNVIIDNADILESTYGRISKVSFTSLQRSLLMLEDGGNDILFSAVGEVFDIREFFYVTNGKGVINILKATQLIKSPQVYAVFLLWLMVELFEVLPERGDAEKPLLAIFLDESHLLFKDAPKILTDKIENLIRLIRSKGVCVIFCTQCPSDIPDAVLGQLGNRVLHSMKAFTLKEQKSIRTLAQTFRQDGSIDIEDEIMNLKIGEALISFLNNDGAPSIVSKALVCPPRSKIG